MAATMKIVGLLTVFVCYLKCIVAATKPIVTELTDEIGPWKQKDDAWLVMFYAPWCGHCRQMTPTYHRVGQELLHSDINVGKLDCTIYGSVAGIYDVRGFPTVKYIRGQSNFTHRGERTKDDIVEFTRKAHGPAVREVRTYAEFVNLRSIHAEGVFFMYVGELGPNQQFLTNYANVAEKYRIYSYFYKGEPKVLPKDIKVDSPSVIVFKDKIHFVYKETSDEQESLSSWISGERYTAFPRVEGANLNEMAAMNKLLVIVSVEGVSKDDRTKQQLELLATTKRDRYHKHFQFVWMSNNDAVDSITMSTMPYPSLLVLNLETQLYYLPEGRMDQLELSAVEQFLSDVKEEKVQAFGGTGVGQRIKRVFYDLLTSVYSIWVQSRILFFIMFGVPSMIISVVCYGLCCMETSDEYPPEDMDESDNEIQEQNKPLLPKSADQKKSD